MGRIDISNIKPGDFVKIRTYDEMQRFVDKKDLYERFWYTCGDKSFKVKKVQDDKLWVDFRDIWQTKNNGRIDITYVKSYTRPMYLLSDDLFRL